MGLPRRGEACYSFCHTSNVIARVEIIKCGVNTLNISVKDI
ncbi:hypothetical protein [Sulfolobus sp. S-194]|nr:hypothetical protein [Sulfolobus sp. S-194]